MLRACNNRRQPQSLTCKHERRTRDYMRSHRMGTSSKDLEEMRDEIKTHRSTLDHHTDLARSERADDATDTTLLGHDATLRTLPQNNPRAASQCQCFQPKPNLATQSCWDPTTTMPTILPRDLCAPMPSMHRALINYEAPDNTIGQSRARSPTASFRRAYFVTVQCTNVMHAVTASCCETRAGAVL